MPEKTYTAGNKKIHLVPESEILAVVHKKPLDSKKALDVISNREGFSVESAVIKTYPKYEVSLVSGPIKTTNGQGERFSESLDKDEDVQFVTSAFKDKETGATVIITDKITVQFKPQTTKEEVDKILSELNCTIVEQSKFSPNQYVVKIKDIHDVDKTLEISEKLSNNEKVRYTDPLTFTEIKKASLQIPQFRYFREQWHLHNTGQGGGSVSEDVKALEAWQITKGSREIVVACLDDGLAYDHVDLKDNAWTNPDATAPDKFGYNFYDDIPSPEPIYFRPPFDEMPGNDIHGTPCAGVICASGNDVSGIAPECRIMGVKIFGGDNLCPPIRVADAIRYAGIHADILSCSWSGGPPNDVIIDAIREITTTGRNGKGCLVFFATGNESASRIAFPANMSETIAVGASTNEGKRSGYSNFGPELDFLAPSSGGTRGIFTTDLPYPNRGFNIGRPGQGDPEGFFTNSFGGTSSATPLAAGICALLLSLKPELSVNEVRKILRESCEKIDRATANYDSNGFSNTHGYGRINAKRTLDLAL